MEPVDDIMPIENPTLLQKALFSLEDNGLLDRISFLNDLGLPKLFLESIFGVSFEKRIYSAKDFSA